MKSVYWVQNLMVDKGSKEGPFDLEHYFVELIGFLLFTEVLKCCGRPLGPHFLVQLPRTQKLLGTLFERI